MKYRELTPNEIEAYNIGYKNGSRQAVIKVLEYETPEEKIFYRQGYNAGCQDRKRHNVSTNEIVSNVSNVSNVDSYDSAITNNNTIVDNNVDKDSNKGGMGGKEKEETKPKNKTSSVLQIDFNRRESFIRAEPKSLVDALKRDIVPNLCAYLYTGKEPTDEQLNNYVQTRAATGWEKKGGTAIRSIGADLASWLKRENPQRNEFEQQALKMSDKPITYEEMIAQTEERE